MNRKRLLASGVVLAASALTAVVSIAYARDIRRARRRVSFGSRTVNTSCGPLEYAIAGGDGETVLIVHGAGGGYDQGLDLADPLIRAGYRVVSVSRFGYLRTPLPADASAAAQADAFDCLLEAMGVPRAVVVGVSAGGPSSMQFALRHPHRVEALILLVPAAYPPPAARRATRVQRQMVEASLRSDLAFWLAMRLAPRAFVRTVLGTPPNVLDRATADDRLRVARLLEHILPVTMRRQGLLNDAEVVSTLPRYDLEQIRVPTLIVSARDDGYGTYTGARYSAQHIPGAQFIGYESGGHLLVGHQQEVFASIEAFLHSSRADAHPAHAAQEARP